MKIEFSPGERNTDNVEDERFALSSRNKLKRMKIAKINLFMIEQYDEKFLHKAR